jgi:hypothetical protein
MLSEVVMQSQSSPSVHNRRHEKHFHRNRPLLRVLLEAAGAMTLVVGVIATSPAGGDRTQAREVAHDFELVDFQPLDTGDDEAMMEESDEDTSSETPMEETETSEDPMEETETSEGAQLSYENCAAARADGAAPIQEGEPGFAPHLDGDNDGIGCEQAPAAESAPLSYENCDAARADGAAPIQEGEPGYGPHLDGDGDGTGCE